VKSLVDAIDHDLERAVYFRGRPEAATVEVHWRLLNNLHRGARIDIVIADAMGEERQRRVVQDVP
jgi:hypothetical protein